MSRIPLGVLLRALATFSLVLATPAHAESVVVGVPATANPYLAGMPSGSTCCAGDAAPAQSPVQVTGLTLTPGSTITFSATGGVNFQPGPITSGPDGGSFFSTASSNGISGATWPENTLVGVFLDASQPDSTSAPASLDFSTGGGTTFATLSPALKQVFFIGDGRTGTGTGATQAFVVPAGATRLFLGVSDGVGWFNNVGSFSATVSAGAAPVAASTEPIPTLSLPMLIAVALALGGIATLAIRSA